MPQIPLYKKWLSWFYPVTIVKKSSGINPLIYLKRYHGQLILTGKEAIYSHGIMYTPFRLMYKHISQDIPRIKTMLVLGTGLGSALAILQQKYHHFPEADLVDIDEEILKLSMEYMHLNSHHNVEWHADDALHFIQHNHKKYDLIALDLFREMETPKPFRERSFYEICYQQLNPEGIICLNTIPLHSEDEQLTHAILSDLFSKVQPISYGRNTFYICYK